MLSQSYLDTLLSRIDLVEYIGQFVSLNRAGSKYKGLCPFHEEKSPSFVVAPTHYHCYGCNVHGNAFEFVMAREGLDFMSAVKQLADRAGMAVPSPRESSEKHEQADMREVLDWASAEFHRLLYHSPSAQAAWTELGRRDIESDTILRFRLGFAPDAWRTLSDSDRFHPFKLAKAGLAVKPERGAYYDLFRNRLIFPILDSRGRVIGFGGRRLSDDGAKYINSPETPLYRKSEELFGIHQALPSIRKTNEVIVAEGYFDVLTPAQNGVENVVAPCGTALTIEQVRRLLVLADNLVMCFDGDAAGAKATWRSVELLLPEVQDRHTIRLVSLPAEHDPDSLVREQGPETFRQIIDNSPTMIQFILQELATRRPHAEAEAQALIWAGTLWRKFSAPIQAELFRKAIQQLFGLTDGDFHRLIGARTPPGDEGLWPCPCCGQTAAHRILDADQKIRVACGNCGITTPAYDNEDSARQHWNRRERRPART